MELEDITTESSIFSSTDFDLNASKSIPIQSQSMRLTNPKNRLKTKSNYFFRHKYGEGDGVPSSSNLDLREAWKFKILEPQNKMFGWIFGVFIPVLINLLCVTYFINLPSIIHDLGWFLSVFMFFISFFVSCCTVGSICVIATNGEMQDGGCYYLISRTLGPELGAATGITLAIAHATAISARLHYLSELITSFYHFKPFTKSIRWDRTVLHLGLCIVIYFLGLPGLKFVVLFLTLLVILLFIGVIVFIFGFFTRKPLSPSFFTGLSINTFTKNFHIPENITFWGFVHTFGLLFPTSNAVMTCANFSGCLHNPQRAIPNGAFSALSIGALFILITILLESGTFNYDNLSGTDIKYMPFAVSKSPVLTDISFISSCIGSALTMTTGGARILVQMVNDGLLPQWFNKWNFNGEAIIPHIFITLITFVFAFIDESTTSTRVTNLVFLIPFALINFAVYIASSAHYPGFRPTFKFYNQYLSLFLTLFCIGRMFLISWPTALISIGVFFIIYGYWIWRKPKDAWGTVTQSRIYYSTLKEELNLYHVKPQVKTYRPNILFVTTIHPDERRTVLDLITELLHGFGMTAVGRVFIKPKGKIESLDYRSIVEERDGTNVSTSFDHINFTLKNQFKRKMAEFININSNYHDAFYDITVASSFHEGVRDLLLLMGIGMTRPNILCLNYPDGWERDRNVEFSPIDFYNSIHVAIESYFGLFITRNSEYFNHKDREGTIDVWWLNDDGGLTLLLPFILSRNNEWKNAKLRVFSVASYDRGDTLQENQSLMAQTLLKVRIFAEVITVITDFSIDEPCQETIDMWNNLMDAQNIDEKDRDDPTSKRYMIMSELLQKYSSNASFVAITMPTPRENDNYRKYMSWLEIMSKKFIETPVCYIRGTGENTLSWKM